MQWEKELTVDIDFEDGEKGHKPREVESFGKLEKAEDKFSSENPPPERKAVLLPP